MSLNIDNLLSGSIGAILAILLSSLISIYLFKKQMKYESNRDFLLDLIKTLQDIHLSASSNVKISDDAINRLAGFQAISFKEIRKLHSKIDALKDAIFKYNSGLSKLLESTVLTQEIIQAQKSIEKARDNIMNEIDKIT